MKQRNVRICAIAAVAVVATILTALSPFVADASDGDTAVDKTFYRYTVNFTNTSEDTQYVIWDFGDGTILDGRWEYYVAQSNLDEESREVVITPEIQAGIDAYKSILASNGNSIYNPIHTYADKGNYTITISAINPLGYLAPGAAQPYDGAFFTDSTRFDGGLAAGITPQTYDDNNKTTSGSWDFNSRTYAIMGYPVITFDSNGGSAVAPLTVENTNVYTAATQPAEPTRSGHTFLGWYTDAGLTEAYDWSSLVRNDMTLYAKWIDSPIIGYDHKLSFYDGTTKLGEQNKVTASAGNESIIIEQANPSKEGFTFKGWGLTSSGDAVYQRTGEVSVPTTGLDLFAIWESNTPPAPDEPAGNNDGNNIIPIAILIAGIIVVVAGFFFLPVVSLVGIGAIVFAILELLNVINIFQ